jgi:hypothetical protein
MIAPHPRNMPRKSGKSVELAELAERLDFTQKK